ncbi:aminoglycoside phosphotransferase family protein [Caldimonas caldifontis]|uniref:Aminoglycoside phosphotransferase n=1 Tax=Caldimonas caldifontis TaxID=1452508 RepID=A0A2S5SUK2_9BURK|nr:phosphotransferase [Caldimonas caldifontis]PPE66237.1 aminoglycoside phosphotransferase [Caldimonas caldifontis]
MSPIEPVSPASSPVSTVSWSDPARERSFHAWLDSLQGLGLVPGSVRPASADASFRRYLRIDTAHGTRIVMDAPPSHEDCRPFVQLARLLRAAGLQAPEILAWHEAEGFMLLSDLGSTTYLQALTDRPDQADALYRDALAALVRLQGLEVRTQVPAYDRALLLREMQLFPDWYITRHQGLVLSEKEQAVLERSFEHLLANALDQPAVLVHRDYHCRNLMLCGEPGSASNPGVLDFQDAVWGPITYDLVSLLRDAYVEWDEAQQIDWAVRYWEGARHAGLPVRSDFGEFWRDLEWMGLQRHLKVLGIFCRLYHRDGKEGYLKDLPLVWRHAHRVASRYREFAALAQLLEKVAGEQRRVGYTF